STLEPLPNHLLSHILSFVPIADRIRVGECSKTLAAAVANCDLFLPDSIPIRIMFRQVGVIRPGQDDITEVSSEDEMHIVVGKLSVEGTNLIELDRLFRRLCNKVHTRFLEMACDDMPLIPIDLFEQATSRFIYKELRLNLNRRIPRNLDEFCDRFACENLCLTNMSLDADMLLGLPAMNRLVSVLMLEMDDQTLLALVAQQNHRSLTGILDLVDPNTVIDVLQASKGGGNWSFVQLLIPDPSLDRVLALLGYRQFDYVEGSLAHYQHYSWRLF
ncbi:hypothetical protein PFISCL1PPCAC_25387, partial [Pristionchus fissidentatus]